MFKLNGPPFLLALLLTLLCSPWSVNASEVADLQNSFSELKSKSSYGRMDKQVLRALFERPLPESFLNGLFLSMDDNGDGFIDIREFVCGMSTLCRPNKETATKCKLNEQLFTLMKITSNGM